MQDAESTVPIVLPSISAFTHLTTPADRRRAFTDAWLATVAQAAAGAGADSIAAEKAAQRVYRATFRSPETIAALQLDASITTTLKETRSLKFECIFMTLLLVMVKSASNFTRHIEPSCEAIEANFEENGYHRAQTQPDPAPLNEPANGTSSSTATSASANLVSEKAPLVTVLRHMHVLINSSKTPNRVRVCLHRCILMFVQQPDCTDEMLRLDDFAPNMSWLSILAVTPIEDAVTQPDRFFRPAIEHLVEFRLNSCDLLAVTSDLLEDPVKLCPLVTIVQGQYDIVLLLRLLLIELKSGRLADVKRKMYMQKAPKVVKSKTKKKPPPSVEEMLSEVFEAGDEMCVVLEFASEIMETVYEWQKTVHKARYPEAKLRTDTENLRTWLEEQLALAPDRLYTSRIQQYFHAFGLTSTPSDLLKKAVAPDDPDADVHETIKQEEELREAKVKTKAEEAAEVAEEAEHRIPILKLIEAIKEKPDLIHFDEVCPHINRNLLVTLINQSSERLMVLAPHADFIVEKIGEMDWFDALIMPEGRFVMSQFLIRHLVEPHADSVTDPTDFMYRIFDALLNQYDRLVEELPQARGTLLLAHFMADDDIRLFVDPTTFTAEYVQQLTTDLVAYDLAKKAPSTSKVLKSDQDDGDAEMGYGDAAAPKPLNTAEAAFAAAAAGGVVGLRDPNAMSDSDADADAQDEEKRGCWTVSHIGRVQLVVKTYDDIAKEMAEWQEYLSVRTGWHSAIPRVKRVIQRFAASGLKWDHNGMTYIDDLMRGVCNKESERYGLTELIEQWIAYHHNTTDWLHEINGEGQNWHQVAKSMRDDKPTPRGFSPDQAMVERVIGLFEAESRAWSEQRWPQIRSELQDHLIPDIASIIVSYVAPPTGSDTIIKYVRDFQTFEHAMFAANAQRNEVLATQGGAGMDLSDSDDSEDDVVHKAAVDFVRSLRR